MTYKPETLHAYARNRNAPRKGTRLRPGQRVLPPTAEAPVLYRAGEKSGFVLLLHLQGPLALQTLGRLAKCKDRAGVIERSLARNDRSEMMPTENVKVAEERSAPNWPLVRVRWVDSTTPRMGWIRLSEWAGVGSLECVSVGYLVAEDGRSKTLAPHLAYPEDGDQCQGNGIIVIPLPAILSIENLCIIE